MQPARPLAACATVPRSPTAAARDAGLCYTTTRVREARATTELPLVCYRWCRPFGDAWSGWPLVRLSARPTSRLSPAGPHSAGAAGFGSRRRGCRAGAAGCPWAAVLLTLHPLQSFTNPCARHAPLGEQALGAWARQLIGAAAAADDAARHTPCTGPPRSRGQPVMHSCAPRTPSLLNAAAPHHETN
jgi:hypothetical protein